MSTLDHQWANYGQQAIVFVQPAAKNRFYIWEKRQFLHLEKIKRRIFFGITCTLHKNSNFSPWNSSTGTQPRPCAYGYGCLWATRILLNCCKKTVWPANLKIFTICALKENICQRHCFGPFWAIAPFYIINIVVLTLLSKVRNIMNIIFQHTCLKIQYNVVTEL